MKKLLIVAGLLAFGLLAFGLFPERQFVPAPDLAYAGTLGRPGPHNDRQRLPDLPMALVFERERGRILSRQDDGRIVAWDLGTGGSRVVARTDSLFAYCRGEALLLVSDAAGVALYDLDGGTQHHVSDLPYDHGSWDDACSKVALAQEESFEVALWHGRPMAQRGRIDTVMPVRNGLRLSGDGRYLAIAEGIYEAGIGHDTALEVFGLAPEGTARRSALLDGSDRILGMWTMAFAPGSDSLPASNSLIVGSQVAARSGLRSLVPDGGAIRWGHDGFASYWVRALAVSPDGRLLASGDEKGLLRFWDLASGRKVAERRTGLVIQALAFSEDGAELAVALWDSTIGIVSVPDLKG